MGDRSIEEHLPMVHCIAGQVWLHIGASTQRQMEYDDLLGYGVLGLEQAIRRYDPSRGVAFASYASLRIRGAIMDGLRLWDRLKRSHREAIARGEMVEPVTIGLPPNLACAEWVQRERLDRHLARLPDDIADVLSKYYWHYVPLGTLAKETGINRRRVGEMRQEGIRRIRRQMDVVWRDVA